MDAAAMLDAYDSQLREAAEVSRFESVSQHGPLWWADKDGEGFVTYRDLGGLHGAELDAAIAATVAHFRAAGVREFEWKSRGHDAPADLGERLVAAGLVAEEVETVMIGPAAALARVPVAVPDEVSVRVVAPDADAQDVAADVAAVLAMQSTVFGSDRGPRADELTGHVLDGSTVLALAETRPEAGGSREVVAAGTLVPVPGTAFAGIWGGGTLAQWRGRGIYRALVAARAGEAVRRGVEWIQSDCTDMSRPILERAGLTAVTTTTPYLWRSTPH